MKTYARIMFPLSIILLLFCNWSLAVWRQLFVLLTTIRLPGPATTIGLAPTTTTASAGDN